jgi:leucyl aminopeptidase
VVFVGKGITFDTGGISIKPADKMWDMRADMAGAAACAGAMLALARRNSPAPAIAILAIAENTTGGNSYRPGDVLKMYSGTTVQVVDTDAEGRLVLADALAYATREKPQAIIDLATLTGSIVVALGHEMAGCFDNDPALAAAAASAGAAVGEKLWRMPIGESHRRALDSDIADLKHCVDERGQPDACQAAAFLREFVGETPWLHLDIAGVEAREEAGPTYAKGATGFGVRLLDRLIADRFEDPHRCRTRLAGPAWPHAESRPACCGDLRQRSPRRCAGRLAVALRRPRLAAARHRCHGACGFAADLADPSRRSAERSQISVFAGRHRQRLAWRL